MLAYNIVVLVPLLTPGRGKVRIRIRVSINMRTNSPAIPLLFLSTTTHHHHVHLPHRPLPIQKVSNNERKWPLFDDEPSWFRLSLDPTKPHLTAEQKSTLLHNIHLLRDAIVLFTATGAARGVSGHTGAILLSMLRLDISCNTHTLSSSLGGAYDTVPEVCILLALFNHSEKFHPVVFDEAGQYMRILSYRSNPLMTSQDIALPPSTSSLLSKVPSHLNSCCTTVPPILSSLVTPSLA